jgi:serine protease AprX
MNWYTQLSQHRSMLYRMLSIGLLGAIIIAAIATAPLQHTEPRATASLLRLAESQPTESVSIVVQTLPNNTTVPAELTRLGGTMHRQLPIIHGFSATLEARAVPELARHQGVRWISPDAPLVSTNCDSSCYNSSTVISAYVKAIGADKVWNRSTPLRGRGIGVAVLDSGVQQQQDLYLRNTGMNRLVGNVSFHTGLNRTAYDAYGHGTHVAGIIGGSGSSSSGQYVGVAPEVKIINVKVSDDTNQGIATTSSLVAGMEWVLNNRQTHNIRVVNISLSDSEASSYHEDALNAAVELLWFNGIVVVTSAGNRSDGMISAPGNDPFVITVGATDDKGTPTIGDDVVASWSAYGTTTDGFAKPDLVAPGVNIVSLPGNGALQNQHPQHVVTTNTGQQMFRMSGTSMAAPMVAAAAALLLQDEPNLTPDQVKFRLMATATRFGTVAQAGSGYLNIPAAIDGTTTQSANTGIQISRILQDGTNSVQWNSASWSTAKWSTAKWSTAKWSTAKWSTSR